MANDLMNRRRFLTQTGTAAAVVTTGVLPTQSAEPEAANAPNVKKEQIIGIQIGSISFLDEGTEKVLDILQEQARVNTLFLARSLMAAASRAGNWRDILFLIMAHGTTTIISTEAIMRPRIRNFTRTRFSRI